LLPATDGAIRASAATDLSGAPAWVQDLARRVVLHLGPNDAPQDFRDVPLDVSTIGRFPRRVYELLREVGPGRTTTYGELARRAGSAGAARAVGAAMANNRFLLVVPCHRVLGAGGALGGFSAPGGTKTKRVMLDLEKSAQEPLPNPLPYDAKVATRHLARVDARMRALVARVGPLRLQISPTPSLFDALSRAILHQQLSTKAATTIDGRFRALLDPAAPAASVLRLSDQELRGAGVSAPKLRALRDLAAKTEGRALPSLEELGGMGDEAIVETLTGVRGIGPWTVHMLLIFRLGRPDVWPTDDYGVRKGFALTYRKRELPSPKELAALGDKFRPWRSVASWYLWRALE
jgi:methylated-DNA-[protein]-cysteine S-methyltransferase